MDGTSSEVLNDAQKTELEELKIQKKIENEKYLRDHPEVRLIISRFLKEVFQKEPSNIPQFAAELFGSETFKADIDKLLEEAQSSSL
ncbi:RIIa domain-containing protein 1-like [Limulus polyphemus]|uniref:RIIa domain-containing protein 1-like n=1 Tax=Limulus polyphemus TaxID=6850 RepID=A0ABM1BJ49_LIMPO|nr:RIIa domain-containing protein 1-like [Limulus polyphemus]